MMKLVVGTALSSVLILSLLVTACFTLNPRIGSIQKKCFGGKACTLSGPKRRLADSRLSSTSDPLDEFSEERKATLFQFLLRDLQVENVPLLAVDVCHTNTLQAALWTTLAELNADAMAQKACLVLEEIPISTLKILVEGFANLKKEQRLLQHIPELERFSLSLVGKGIGPAILIEATNATRVVSEAAPMINTVKYDAAMKMFLDRIDFKENLSAEDEAAGMAFRMCAYDDIFHIQSAFWNCICELETTNGIGSTVLSLPLVSGTDHDRFAATTELISHGLLLFQGDEAFELFYFSPGYERDAISPIDQPTHGHLPPTSFLREMLKKDGYAQEAEQLTLDDLLLLNYQRRSPITSVIIKRASLVNEVSDTDSTEVELELEDKQIAPARDISRYSRNAVRLASLGRDALESAAVNEWQIASTNIQ
jgi:hypothetical protein